MNFEIDVSGSDIFEKDYTIMVAERGNSKIMLGYKMQSKTIEIIRARFGQQKYRYKNSKEGKSNLKIRIYCVAIYFLFKELKKRQRLKSASLNICRDFSGNEEKIKQNLGHFLGKKLGLETSFVFEKLAADSIAHRYAFLVRKDSLNKLCKYAIRISVENFEEFLK